jgi:hypothetical protein
MGLSSSLSLNHAMSPGDPDGAEGAATEGNGRGGDVPFQPGSAQIGGNVGDVAGDGRSGGSSVRTWPARGEEAVTFEHGRRGGAAPTFGRDQRDHGSN